MYAQYWGLQDTPFANHLEARWFYESPVHEEALARLLYLVEENRRCGVFYGPPGVGKSLVLRVLSRQVRRMQRQVASIDLVGRSASELLWELNAALGLAPRDDDGSPTLWRQLQDHLQGNQVAGQPTVLLFDHLERAQPDCVGLIERLIHLQTRSDQWTTLVLTLRDDAIRRHAVLLREMSDLRIELPRLDRAHCQLFLRAILQKAGRTEPIFEPAAFDRLFELSGGVPRELIRLADLALVAGTADGEARIGESQVRQAALDLSTLTDMPAETTFATSRL